MKRKQRDLDFKYINGRIDRLYKQVREIENLLYKWGRKYMELEDKKEIGGMK